jgi:hypothetical protein
LGVDDAIDAGAEGEDANHGREGRGRVGAGWCSLTSFWEAFGFGTECRFGGDETQGRVRSRISAQWKLFLTSMCSH